LRSQTVIYFVQRQAEGDIKIGTTICLTERLVQIETAVGAPVEVLAVMEGSFSVEKQLHDRFAHLNREGEWFLASADLIEFINHSAAPWNGRDERAPYGTAKVDKGVVRKAKFVADSRDISLAEYLSDLLRAPVDRDFSKASRKAIEGESGV
jgi:hypothetical protein